MKILFQFPISHYCEKVAWALDYKKIAYRKVHLIPGPHILVTKLLGDKTSVPIFTDGNKSIQDSTEILHYLEKQYPELTLNYHRKSLADDVIAMEEYLDKEIGVHLRRYFYFICFQHDAFLKNIMSQQNPYYTPYLLKLILPSLKLVMTKSMRVYEAPSLESKNRLLAVVKKLNKILKKQNFLVGNRFTRADITAAALLAPLIQPDEHPFPWPQSMPAELGDLVTQVKKTHTASWVREMYQNYR